MAQWGSGEGKSRQACAAGSRQVAGARNRVSAAERGVIISECDAIRRLIELANMEAVTEGDKGRRVRVLLKLADKVLTALGCVTAG